jgi:hypothetical protein
MPGKHESSTESSLASDDGGPLKAQATTSSPSLVLGSRPVRSMLVRCLPNTALSSSRLRPNALAARPQA